MLTIYKGHPEISFGKSNGSCHPTRGKALENTGFVSMRCNFSTLVCLFRVVLSPRQILYFYVHAQKFHPGGL